MTAAEYQRQLEELEQMNESKAHYSHDRSVRQDYYDRAYKIHDAVIDRDALTDAQEVVVSQVLSRLQMQLTKGEAMPPKVRAAYEAGIRLEANKELIRAGIPMKGDD